MHHTNHEEGGMLEMTFDQAGDFKASAAAEAWCAERGISVGHAQRGDPRGLLYGDFDIQKWRNLRPSERRVLDGQMTGDMRNGPVYVRIKARAAA